MTTYTKGQPGDLPEILDFINMVFSMHQRPHNFQTLLPKLYGPASQTESYHYLAKEDGKLCAVVCALPITIVHNGQEITCATVGSVSVHPYSRGKGYMKKLMAMATEDMEQQGITISALSGRRHRYQYYGYELGGCRLDYQFIADNFRHTASRYPAVPISLIPVASDDTKDISEKASRLNRLYSSQPVHTIRTDNEFLSICSSWNSSLYEIVREDTAVGYLCGTANQIYELVLTDESLIFSTLKAYFSLCGCERLTMTVPSYQKERIKHLTGLYEHWSVQTEDNYRIFNYSEAIRFFLSVKAAMMPLTEGSLVLEIEGSETICITVASGKISVLPVDKEQEPNLRLSGLEAVALLFSPISGYTECSDPYLSAVNWFPLPLSISHLDKC